VFYDGAEQLAAVEATRSEYELASGGKVQTDVEPLSGTQFWRAEDYHQKYYLRQIDEVAREFTAIYPDPAAFTDSTAASRANGYIGRHVYSRQAQEELPLLGLSEKAQARLALFVPDGVPQESVGGCGEGVCELPPG
jgi:peptide-methionine (S)-S-oxide reductase